MYKTFAATKAIAHLRHVDSSMATLIDLVGKCRLEVNDSLTPFQTLLRAIVYQKLATHSAAAIYSRIQGLCSNPSMMTPTELLSLDADVLRDAGLSGAKLAAVTDLAVKSLEGLVPGLPEMEQLSDEEIIARVTEVRGIGRWTVEMLLIYRLGRTDVLPVGDFAVRKGFQLAYGKSESPTPAQLARFGERWAPHRTVASWYLWRATDSVDWEKKVSSRHVKNDTKTVRDTKV